MIPEGLSPFEWVLWGFSTFMVGGLVGMVATIVFDLVHMMLHVLMPMRGLLGKIGALHAAHHEFVDKDLKRHPEWEKRNLWMHVVPEFGTQVLVALAFVFLVGWLPVLVIIGINIVGFVGNFFYYRGYDFNHAYTGPLPRPLSQLWVTPSYHLLHHVWPDNYFASFVPFVDKLFGKSLQIAGRRFVVTGASGAFGKALCELLEAAGARVVRLKFGDDWRYGDLRGVAETLASADVLVLAHGSKVKDAMDANCTSFVDFIELFRKQTTDRQLPPEIWALGSEIEAHPHFGVEDLKVYSASKRAFARHARRYYRDREILYRHIVPSAFTSPMGPGLMSGRTCARVALFFMRRGVRYVPVTYTGVALLNFFKFLLPLPAAPAPQNTAHRLTTAAPARLTATQGLTSRASS